MEENQSEKHMLTQAGYDKKQKELEWRKVEYRKEIANKLKEAREQGDLSENAEYDAAKDEQRDNEAMIAQLEEELANSVVIKEEGHVGKKTVHMQSRVQLLDVELDQKLDYTLVGSAEADILNNLISNESPLGAAILGHKAGDTVVVDAPAGQLPYKILAVVNE